MPLTKLVDNQALLQAALEGLELQKQRIDDQIREVRSRLNKGRRAGGPATTAEAPTRHRRRLSAEARKRIAAAQKKRWAAFRRKSSAAKGAAKAAAGA
jgi:predicted  nucleic acid-binding Zn-ribbon protein